MSYIVQTVSWMSLNITTLESETVPLKRLIPLQHGENWKESTHVQIYHYSLQLTKAPYAPA